MNYELTLDRARHRFRLQEDPDALLGLPASQIMERTGDVFDPKFYMVDTDTQVVYRKEQFSEGTELPAELVVRDRRFTKLDIEGMCEEVGLEVVWSRYVRAGRWEEDAGALGGKEILVLCRLP